MTNVNLNINVTQTGARSVRRSIQDIVDVARDATRTLRLFQNALFVLGGAGLVGQLQKAFDSLTNFENRIRLVTRSSDELQKVQSALFDVAERTRSSFEGTAEIYTRVALSVQALGKSQEDVIAFTESLNQAVILSGASAREANAALVQLGQGLASNRLGGDELRSVLEQLPFVADVIAKSLNVTRGELRQFGRDGKLTAEVVLKAFKDAREEIAGKFKETIPTIGQSFEVLKTKFLRTLDAFDDLTETSSKFAKIVLFIADNLDSLLRLLGAAAISATVFGAGALAAGVNILYLRTAIGAVTRAIIGLTAAALANPLTAVAAGIVATLSVLFTFSDQIAVTADGFVKLSDAGVAAIELITENVGPLVSSILNDLGPAILFATGLFGFLNTQSGQIWDDILAGLRNFTNTMIAVFIATRETIVQEWGKIPTAFKEIFVRAFNVILDAIVEVINGTLDAIRQLFAAIDALAEKANIGKIFGDSVSDININLDQFKGKISGAGEEVAKTFSDSFNAQIQRDFVGEAIDAVIKRARQRAIGNSFETLVEGGQGRSGAGGGGDDKFNKIAEKLRDENALLQVNFQEREVLRVVLEAERKLKRDLTEDEKGLLVSLKEQNILLEDQSKVYEAIRGPQNEYERQTRALVTLLADGKVSVEEFNRKFRDLRITFLETQNDVSSGLERGILQFLKSAEDFGSQFETVLKDAFSGIEDAFVNFVQTGKLDFKQLANSIIADLARIVARVLIIRPLLQALGGVFGGGGSGSIPGFATGGSIFVGGSGGVDSQLVVARATPGERIDFTPPGRASSSGGTSVVVNNFSGAPVRQETRKSAGGQDIVEIIVGRVNEAISGGRMDSSLRGRFGLAASTVSR